MANAYLVLVAGIVCAGVGGELFVRGAVGMARALRVSPGIIAATVAAFATSSPELTVAINAALAGAPEISFGDALGSNVANIALVLGLALLIAPITARRASMRRDFPVALLAPVVIAILLVDHRLSRLDGALLLVGFVVWLVAVTREAAGERSAAATVLGESKPYRAVVESLIGLAFLVAAGKLVVSGATEIARSFGVSEFAIGATVVAIGTSVPELATAIISRLRGHDEVGLGTVLGSNIFNGLLIVGTTAAITPIAVPLAQAAPALVLGVATVALSYPSRSGIVARWRGGMLLAVYVVFVMTALQAG